MNDFLSNISPVSYSTSAVILANILAEGLSIDEQNTIANWFELVGQTMITNAGQQQLIQDNKNDNTDDSKVQIKG